VASLEGAIDQREHCLFICGQLGWQYWYLKLVQAYLNNAYSIVRCIALLLIKGKKQYQDLKAQKDSLLA
jgi:uncharacterized phage-like protein YoqJ